jgi:outer membrane protein insertion porin family
MTIRSTLFPARLVYPVVATCALSVGVVHAQANQFVVKDIEVEGLRRTEAGTVFSYLPIRVGDPFAHFSQPVFLKMSKFRPKVMCWW